MILYYIDPRKPCKCSAAQIDRYLARISGPLLERIDMGEPDFERKDWEKLTDDANSGLRGQRARAMRAEPAHGANAARSRLRETI